MSKLRLMSQNMWNNTPNIPFWEEKGLDCSSATRMKGHIKVLSELMPDVLGGQEVNMDMQLDFKINCISENLPYTIIWGSMTPIIYRADKLELLDTEFFMYPKFVDGFEGEFNDFYSKNCNLAVFRCKEGGEVFIYVTTHLCYRKGAVNDVMRKMQIGMAIDLIEKYQNKYGKCPVFLMGDMNTGYHTDAIQYALNDRGFSHAHDIATEFAYEGVGYNGCTWTKIGEWLDEPFPEAIDHILVRNYENVNVKRFDRYTPDYYIYLSDHAPLFADIEFISDNFIKQSDSERS